jgi:hypothetical protein
MTVRTPTPSMSPTYSWPTYWGWRVGITKAANSLQQQKLISYRRGDITILNRAGLEAAFCACYWADKEIYERILN